MRGKKAGKSAPAGVPVRTHHLLITGVGRTGSSFLVRYLAELGLDTHLARQSTPSWCEPAQAGLEDLPAIAEKDDLPYVVKSPWMTEYIQEILARDDLIIDAAIISVRDLVEVAASRIITELQRRYKSFPEVARVDRRWENWGLTAGGAVFSLSPDDQARLLALSFHKLVLNLALADIPMVFVAFPRCVEDADYLFEKLKAHAPATISLEFARAAHRTVSDRTKVRVGAELARSNVSSDLRVSKSNLCYPTHEALRDIAISRELLNLNREVSELKSQVTQGQEAFALIDKKRMEDLQLAEMRLEQQRQLGQIMLDDDRNIARINLERVERTLSDERDIASSRLKQLTLRLSQLEMNICEMENSTSWHVTKPMRLAAKWLRQIARVRWLAARS